MRPEFEPNAELPLDFSFRQLCDTTTDSILLFRVLREGQFRLVGLNPSAVRELGLSENNSVGRDLGELGVAPETAALLVDALSRCVEERAAVTHEQELALPSGSRWVRTRVVPMPSAGGELRLLIVVARDITEQRQAARQLSQLKEQFQHAQKFQTAAGLVMGVVHDFNNLLVVTLASSRSLLESLPEDDERHADAVALSMASEHAAALTRQLLAFCRRQPPTSTLTDVRAALQQLVPLLRRLLGKNIEIRTTVSETVDPVALEPGKLDQVVMNLALNARDAMPHGGVIEVALAEVELLQQEPGFPRAVPPGKWVRCSLRDTGTGMSDETLKRLFEPFFTTKDPGRGTGLGLSTVLAIVEEAGGVVQVRSKPGAGSCFDVYLPRRNRTDWAKAS